MVKIQMAYLQDLFSNGLENLRFQISAAIQAAISLLPV